MEKYGQLILYKKNNGKKDIEVKLYDETVWLNQNQLVDLFESRSEYKKYKDRISLNPTEVELHYLEATNELKKLTDKK